MPTMSGGVFVRALSPAAEARVKPLPMQIGLGTGVKDARMA